MERPTRSAPGTPSPLDSPSADQMSRQGYKGSSMRSPSGGTSRWGKAGLEEALMLGPGAGVHTCSLAYFTWHACAERLRCS
eukprot:scaffold228559_cov19-Tisochrysis_lutea.AAC.1